MFKISLLKLSPNVNINVKISCLLITRILTYSKDFFYDLKDMSKFSLQDVQMLAAMGPPGGGRNDITTRMSRHLNVFTIHEFRYANFLFDLREMNIN